MNSSLFNAARFACIGLVVSLSMCVGNPELYPSAGSFFYCPFLAGSLGSFSALLFRSLWGNPSGEHPSIHIQRIASVAAVFVAVGTIVTFTGIGSMDIAVTNNPRFSSIVPIFTGLGIVSIAAVVGGVVGIAEECYVIMCHKSKEHVR